MRFCLFTVVTLTCLCAWTWADEPHEPDSLPSAQSVMARVGENQDRSEADRAHYVYVQHAKVVSRRGEKVICEEITNYRITPSNDGSHGELLDLEGRLRRKDTYTPYHALPPDKAKAEVPSNADTPNNQKQDPPPDSPKQEDEDHGSIRITIDGDSLDRDLVEDLRWDLIHDKSKDGVSAGLFPLTSKEQQDYVFRMVGRERLNGRDVFHLTFRPKQKNDIGWSGNAYIDTTAFQPVLITTGMARKIPFAVRTLLGTNFPGLGFTVTYAPQPDGVWFPVTFSTEFKIHVLFFFHREIILDAQNRDFEKTHVTSRIVGEAMPLESTAK